MSGAARIPPTVANALSEEDFQQQVIEYAHLTGWHAYHTFDSRRSAPGFPDLVLARPPRLLIVELKAEKGRLSIAQSDWLRVLEECGVETHIWKPSDWPQIEQTLKPAPIVGATVRGP